MRLCLCRLANPEPSLGRCLTPERHPRAPAFGVREPPPSGWSLQEHWLPIEPGGQGEVQADTEDIGYAPSPSGLGSPTNGLCLMSHHSGVSVGLGVNKACLWPLLERVSKNACSLSCVATAPQFTGWAGSDPTEGRIMVYMRTDQVGLQSIGSLTDPCTRICTRWAAHGPCPHRRTS